jgi:hypothetical protein
MQELSRRQLAARGPCDDDQAVFCLHCIIPTHVGEDIFRENGTACTKQRQQQQHNIKKKDDGMA